MSTPRKELIKFIADAIECRRGDDLYRARSAFRNFTPEQMNEFHGQSGFTRQQIVDQYVAFEAKCDEAKALLAELSGGAT